MHAEDQHAQKGMLSATYQKLYDSKCPAAQTVKNMKEYGRLKSNSIQLVAVDPNTPVVDPMLAAHLYNIHCVTDRCHAFAKLKIRTKICVLYVHNINYHNNLF